MQAARLSARYAAKSGKRYTSEKRADGPYASFPAVENAKVSQTSEPPIGGEKQGHSACRSSSEVKELTKLVTMSNHV